MYDKRPGTLPGADTVVIWLWGARAGVNIQERELVGMGSIYHNGDSSSRAPMTSIDSLILILLIHLLTSEARVGFCLCMRPFLEGGRAWRTSD